MAFSFTLKDTPLLNIKSQWTTASPSESLQTNLKGDATF